MITNKESSKEFIKRHKLNTVWTSKLLYGFPIGDIINFLLNLIDGRCTGKHVSSVIIKDFDYYGIRDNEPGGLFSWSVPKNELLSVVYNNYQRKYFTVCESMYHHDIANLLIQGDFYLTEDFILSCGYSTIKGQSLRESSKNFQNTIWGLDLKCDRQRHYLSSNVNEIIDYLAKNNLFGVIVELTMYNCKVGINEENILVWEVRNY